MSAEFNLRTFLDETRAASHSARATARHALRFPPVWPFGDELREAAARRLLAEDEVPQDTPKPRPGETLLVTATRAHESRGGLFWFGSPRAGYSNGKSPGDGQRNDNFRSLVREAEQLALHKLENLLPLELRKEPLGQLRPWFIFHEGQHTGAPEGDSFLLSLTLAAASCYLDRPIPARLAASVAIRLDEDGQRESLARVDGLEAKLRVISNVALAVRQVLVHEEQLEEATAILRRLGSSLEARPVARLEDAIAIAFGLDVISLSDRRECAIRIVDGLNLADFPSLQRTRPPIESSNPELLVSYAYRIAEAMIRSWLRDDREKSGPAGYPYEQKIEEIQRKSIVPEDVITSLSLILAHYQERARVTATHALGAVQSIDDVVKFYNGSHRGVATVFAAPALPATTGSGPVPLSAATSPAPSKMMEEPRASQLVPDGADLVEGAREAEEASLSPEAEIPIAIDVVEPAFAVGTLSIPAVGEKSRRPRFAGHRVLMGVALVVFGVGAVAWIAAAGGRSAPGGTPSAPPVIANPVVSPTGPMTSSVSGNASSVAPTVARWKVPAFAQPLGLPEHWKDPAWMHTNDSRKTMGGGNAPPREGLP